MGVIGLITDRSTPAIVKNSDSFLEVQFVKKNRDCEPYSFSNFVGASGHFIGTDGIISIAADLVSEDLGKIRLPLAASATQLLEAGEAQSFQVDFQDDSGLNKIVFFDAIEIIAPLYPAE
jgi:hypothetical protein